MAEAANSSTPGSRQRSPGYATINLEDAIARAKTLWTEDKGAAATPEVIASHWNSKISSSAFMQWIASLKRYGLLLETPGSDGTRRLKLSPLALDILLLPPDDPRAVARIKEAALMPNAHAELWQEYGLNLPSDANLRHTLITAKGYKPEAANELIRVYKKTLEFAKLSESDKIGSEDRAAGEAESAAQSGAKSSASLKDGAINDMFRNLFARPQQPGTRQPSDVQHGQKSPVEGQMLQDTFNLANNEGVVILQWPAKLSETSYEDLKDWIELQLRKIGRNVVKPPPPTAEDQQ